MKIIQILNNNVALVKRGKNEIIVFVKGIGFKKRVGQVINENEIERTYILDSYDMLEHFSYLLQNSDSNNIVLINEIIEYGEKVLNIKSSDYLSLTLLEVNKESHDSTIVELRTLADIVSIIKYHFNVEIDETSTNYMRFTTHLQYFIQRIMSDEASIDEDNSIDLYKQVSQLYPKSFGSVQKIRKYIKSQFNVDISISEETYLMLHINRVTQRLEAKSDEI